MTATKQPEPIDDPAYWRDRLAGAEQLHHAVFRCTPERWARIEARHRQILAVAVRPSDSILDAGCAWGRLLTLLPQRWRGPYVGVDLSPDFLGIARHRHPSRTFLQADLRDLSALPGEMADVAVLVSIRPMVRRNMGDAVWDQMEQQLRRVAKHILYLEYDESDPGSLE